MSLSDPFRPPRAVPGSYTWLEGHPEITAEGSQRIFLKVETFAREYLRFGEYVRCIGMYIGPRKVWVCFRPDDEPKGRAAATFHRSEFDRWEKERSE